jgi:hypothetical protein
MVCHGRPCRQDYTGRDQTTEDVRSHIRSFELSC